MTTTTVQGVGVSAGRVSGPVARVAEPMSEPASSPAPADPAAEAARIRPASDAVARRLSDRARAVTGDARSILETTAAMAADSSLLANAEKLVTAHRLPAARAVFEAAEEFTGLLAAAGGYMAERVQDVRDVRDRLIAELTGTPVPGVPELTGPAVLVARDLAPADTADLDPDLVLALVTEEGGPTSHTAILARSLGIPAVVAARGVLAGAAESARVDGEAGTVELLDRLVAVETSTTVRDREWDGVGRTADDQPVKVLANVGSPADAEAAIAAGAEGIGLFRTEFCFLAATSEPDPHVQRAAYAETFAPCAGRPVVVRTLDAGADKPLPFLNAAAEPNPALGVRGIRVAFDRPDILDRQLDAIASAAGDTGADVSVMAPMVATADEAAWFAERARAAGLRRVGVMVEIPSAALCAAEILDAVDFVSVGTNDLAQYAFAADRMTGALAALNDPWQPGLLRLVAMLGSAGRELGKPVGVCGEAAADPLLAGVLAGLGITSLSMVPTALTAVGAALSEQPLARFERAARAALGERDPLRARRAAREAL
ncbi:putative PEP-binding protein [Saccharopolyspora taberi]|uniref:Phosphoenolpyruvate-protein phosphotransferase n=1 Tax=Saccharopolyspora taberi TaxID=60895 RepID=A0ABN3VI15_9PSEU